MRDTRKFWDKVKRGEPDACWPWEGYIGPSGHGRTQHKYVSILASRKAWILTYGDIDNGLCVNHRCDNPLCCNPAHMYLGTRADNMIDRWSEAAADERGRRDLPFSLTEVQIRKMYAMRKGKATIKQCAEAFDVHTRTVVRIITAYRKKLMRDRQAVRRAAIDVQT